MDVVILGHKLILEFPITAASKDAFCAILPKQWRNLFLSVAITIVILTIVRVMMEENVVRSDTEDNDEILCLLVIEDATIS